MTIVFFGSDDFGIPALELLVGHHSVPAVVTTPDKLVGRNLTLRKSPVKVWAGKHDVPYFDYRKESPSDLLEPLKDLRPDLFVVISFGGLLRADFLTLPRLYCLNVHASLLPKYRGASPMQQALLHNDLETGVSVMRMIERLDAGDVLLQKKLKIGGRENILELRPRLAQLGAEALRESIDLIEHGRACFAVQAETKASYAKKNDGHALAAARAVNFFLMPALLRRLRRSMKTMPFKWSTSC